MTPASVDAVEAAVRTVLPSVRRDLERLVRIASISSDPASGPELRRSADLVTELLTDAGMPSVEVLQVDGGHPAVLAHRPGAPGMPRVLLYAHHDVQPVGDRALWTSDPFEPVERDGRLFGRGAADDKAGIALHLAALRALGGDTRIDLTVLVEGEEEIGSPTLPAFLDTYADRLAADVIVLADSTNLAVGRPALTTSLRGGVNIVVEVRTLEHALHNGVYGGPVPDALTALARLLATLHDEAGDLAVAGLSRPSLDGVELDEEIFRADAGVLEGVHLIGTGSIAERLWAGSALSVIGIDAPAVDGAAMTLIPSARAKLTLRVGPADDPAEARDAVLRHLSENAPWGAVVTAEAGRTVRPFRADTTGPGYEAARAAFADAWGVEPVEIGVGGSIDFIAGFAAGYPNAEILVTGVEDPDTRAHAPNESLHLADFERACVAEALLLTRLADGPR